MHRIEQKQFQEKGRSVPPSKNLLNDIDYRNKKLYEKYVLTNKSNSGLLPLTNSIASSERGAISTRNEELTEKQQIRMVFSNDKRVKIARYQENSERSYKLPELYSPAVHKDKLIFNQRIGRIVRRKPDATVYTHSIISNEAIIEGDAESEPDSAAEPNSNPNFRLHPRKY